MNDVENETAKRAEEEGKETTFVDAEQDILAAVEFAKENHASGKVILWGSSYSAALVLRIAGENPGLVDGTLSFAPGEYFERFGKPNDWIVTSVAKIKVPAFITSAKKEEERWKAFLAALPEDSRASFIPKTKGNHGSRALWEKFDDSPDYWEATESFLRQFVEER